MIAAASAIASPVKYERCLIATAAADGAAPQAVSGCALDAQRSQHDRHDRAQQQQHGSSSPAQRSA